MVYKQLFNEKPPLELVNKLAALFGLKNKVHLFKGLAICLHIVVIIC